MLLDGGHPSLSLSPRPWVPAECSHEGEVHEKSWLLSGHPAPPRTPEDPRGPLKEPSPGPNAHIRDA